MAEAADPYEQAEQELVFARPASAERGCLADVH